MARKKSARPELIRFYCSLATIQNAITFRGDGDGGRVVLEVPRSEAGALLLLQQYGAARLLHVTVVLCADQIVAAAADDLDSAIDELDSELEIDDE
jgi:hypothetical protein